MAWSRVTARGGPVNKTADGTAFANLLGQTFQNADEQRAFERDVHDSRGVGGPGSTWPSSLETVSSVVRRRSRHCGSRRCLGLTAGRR